MNSDVKHCQACEGGVRPLTADEIKKRLADFSGWEYEDVQNCLKKTFEFKGYARTIAFVNAIAWIATVENHHPDLAVSFNHCTVTYQTHAVNGVTDNDFICIEKIEALLR